MADMTSRRIIVPVLCCAVAAAAGALYWLRSGPEPAEAAKRPPQSVPVTAARAAVRDLPIYYSGLGTVQASMTAAVHSQVDGKIEAVHFTEGQRVKKGDVLFTIDPRLYQAAYDQAVARKAQDEAQLSSAEKDLVRFKTLAAKDFQTQQALDTQQAKVDQLKASIAGDEAAIESAKTQLDYTKIVAPYDGRIGVRMVDPGNVVHASDATALATVTQTHPSAVLFTLPARLLDAVNDAMKRGPVEVLAFDQDNRRQLATGTLLLVDNQIDQTTATIRLKAMFPNEDDRLWPGEFVNARLSTETLKQAVTIPSEAIQRKQDGIFVWVVTPDGTVEPRTITTGPASDGATVVTSGLSGGEQVVTGGQYKLRVHAPVTVNAATAEAGSGEPG